MFIILLMEVILKTIKILNRFTDAIVYEATLKNNTILKTVERAVKEKVNLSGAYLRRADLSDAYLSGADLRRANLSGADLSGADLSDANLIGANLSDADLSDADLIGANLSGAYLKGAIGNAKKIKSLSCFKYLVTYTSTTMAIGCEQHLISEWKNFSDERIDRMEEGALDWWKENKNRLLSLVEYTNGCTHEKK